MNLEEEYLKKLEKGDHQAFNALFMLYYPKVKNFLFGFIKNDDEARDMAQNIFLKIWTKRENISKIKSLQSYLFTMARNMIYDYYNHNLVKQKYIQKEESKKIQIDDLLEENLYTKELELIISIAIEQMPEQRKRVFLLSRKSGLSNQEIDDNLGINKRTVEKHITQVLADLRKIISTIF